MWHKDVSLRRAGPRPRGRAQQDACKEEPSASEGTHTSIMHTTFI